MTVEFTSEARQDLFSAAEYYEDRQEGLGKRFRDEIEGILEIVAKNPLAYREREYGYRRVNCPIFPYFLAYVIRNTQLVIVAVAHASREPGFWHKRLA